MQTPHERVIVSVGGSLIVPDQLDTKFLTAFRSLILEKIEQGFSFAIIAGGGATARRYQDAAKIVRGDPSQGSELGLPREDLDWLGIHATRLNGHLLRTLFREEAHREVVTNPAQDSEYNDAIVIEAGWRPGWSTDYCAVTAAKMFSATRVANLSNIDYVYTADPRTNKNAKPIEKISWGEFRTLIPAEWDPGIHTPFDPVAAKEAESLHLEVAIMNGEHLDRFAAYLDSKPFIGTVIS